MRKLTSRSIAVLLGLAPAVIAWRAATGPITLQPESRLWINGTSTVRAFQCKAGAIEATIESPSANAVAALVAGEKAVSKATVTVPAEQLECGNGTMNEHMKKALKVKDNPTIEFTVESYTLAKGADGTQAQLNGTLTLGGVTKPITVSALGKGEGDALRVTGAVVVNMKDYGLKPPSLMMGTMKVDELVTVRFDLVLRAAATAAN